MERRAKKVLEEEFKKEVKKEAEKELSDKEAEREFFKVILKEGASLLGDGEKDISESVTWEDGLDANFKWLDFEEFSLKSKYLYPLFVK